MCQSLLSSAKGLSVFFRLEKDLALTRKRNSKLEAANFTLTARVQELSARRDSLHRAPDTLRVQFPAVEYHVETEHSHNNSREQMMSGDSRLLLAPARAPTECQEMENTPDADCYATVRQQKKKEPSPTRGSSAGSTKRRVGQRNGSDWEAKRETRAESGLVGGGSSVEEQDGLSAHHLAQCVVLGFVWGMMGMAWFYDNLLFGTGSPLSLSPVECQ